MNCRVLKRIILRCALVETRLLNCATVETQKKTIRKRVFYHIGSKYIRLSSMVGVGSAMVRRTVI